MLKRIKKLLHIGTEAADNSVYNKIDNLFDTLSDDSLVVYIGTDLSTYIDSIIEVVSNLREEVKGECGFIMPAVSIKENFVIQENEFKICLSEECIEDRFVIPTKDNTCEEVYDALKSVVYNNIDRIFTNEITEKYINSVQRKNGWLIWNLTNVMSVIDIRTILVDIISFGKSIGDINYIFEKIGEQVLSNEDYRDCVRRYNPHIISKAIANRLKK